MPRNSTGHGTIGARVRGVDGVEFFRRDLGDKVPDAVEKVAVAQNADRKNRHEKTANQQADTIYSIRHSNSLQTAEDCVDRANNTDAGAKDRNRLKLGDAQQLIDVENTVERQRAEYSTVGR